MTDDELREFWRANGGTFYGPNVETGAMAEYLLLPLLRRLWEAPQTVERDLSILRKDEAKMARLRKALEAFLGIDLDDRAGLVAMRNSTLAFRHIDPENMDMCVKALDALLEE